MTSYYEYHFKKYCSFLKFVKRTNKQRCSLCSSTQTRTKKQRILLALVREVRCSLQNLGFGMVFVDCRWRSQWFWSPFFFTAFLVQHDKDVKKLGGKGRGGGRGLGVTNVCWYTVYLRKGKAKVLF